MIKKIFNLDIARFVASLMIVAIHVYPFESFNSDLDFVLTRVLFRIAVPFFLMITGFYVLPKAFKDKKVLLIYTKKILILYFLSILLYLPINFYNGAFSSFHFWEFLKAIFFTGTFYHLWYFPALILGLWITYFFIKLFHQKTFLVVFLLYLVGLFGDSYFGCVSNIPILFHFYDFIFRISDYTRNGLFYVPIFLYLGYIFSFKQSSLSFRNQLIFFFLSYLLMGMEGSLLYMGNLSKHTSMYLFLLPTTYFLFSLFQCFEQKSYKNLRNLSTSIYVLHPLVIVGLHVFSKVSYFSSILEHSLVFYFCVLFISLVFSIFFDVFKKKFLK